MIGLPLTLAPAAPFPLVTAQTQSTEFVAPGLQRTEIRLRTTAGPLVIHVLSLDEREPTLHLGVVLAHDRLISAGETVSSMARRTNAIAGVNADYFDIGATNQPLNVVVQNGVLVRSPSKRSALFVGPENRVWFGNATLHGSVTYAAASVPVTGVNIWPPQGGASLLTAAYGPVPTAPSVAVVPLSQTQSLAFGPAAAAIAAPPQAGTPIALTLSLDPPLDGVREAVGGGPLLLVDGAPASDPNEPAPEERNVRFPLAGAGVSGSTLLLVSVDGRIPESSIGLTRPEFAALLAGLGASDALAFDSGGSATLVARVLGDALPSVLNAPSDGIERPVADGLFAYSTAAIGVHPHLFARPVFALALPGAPIPLQAAIVDDAGHRLRSMSISPITASTQAGAHSVTVATSNMATTVDYRTVVNAARLSILPARANLQPGERVGLSAIATDTFGAPIALGPVRWSASAGEIAGEGAAATYRANAGDAVIRAQAANLQTSLNARIGSHIAVLSVFGAGRAHWQFASVPKGMTGSISVSDSGELVLNYDLAESRAAYANGGVALPGEPMRFATDVFGDESGIGVRATFVNGLGERRALTLAKRVNWSGWKRLEIELPPDLNPPVQLVSLYVVRLGEAPLRTSGAIRFRNVAVTLPGSR